MQKKKQINQSDIVASEKASEEEAEAMAHHSQEPSFDEENDPDEEAEKATTVEEAADVDEAVPAEVAAIHTDNQTANEINKKVALKKTKPSTTKSRRSAGYLKAKEQVEAGKRYGLNEAIELVKKISLSKFDGSIEVHLKLAKKKAKTQNESLKGILHLPYGSGKERKIVVLDEAMIDIIAATKKADFDVALASPELMPKVGKIAKILGPLGKMPDPKSGTVTNDSQATIAEIQAGKIDYRIDSHNNLHQIIGKVSWDNQKLADNAQAVLSVLPKSRIEAAYLSASIGPSVPLDTN